MRAGWLRTPELDHVLAALTSANRRVMETCLATGLRVSDALCLRTEAVRAAQDGRLTVVELKTGKHRRIHLPRELQLRMLQHAGRVWVYEGRLDWRKHRTRQAVNKDLARAAKALRVKVHISPHSTRKAWAVDEYHRTGSLTRVQRELCHSDPSITMLYAMADVMEQRKHGGNVVLTPPPTGGRGVV